MRRPSVAFAILALSLVSGGTLAAEKPPPATGSFGPAGPLTEARAAHTTAHLSAGCVLVIGGEDNDGALTAVETWDQPPPPSPPASPLAEPRAGHTATLLPDGGVLVVGGLGAGGERPCLDRRGLGPGNRRVHVDGLAGRGSFRPHGDAPARRPSARRGWRWRLGRDGRFGRDPCLRRGLGPGDRRVRPGRLAVRASVVPHGHAPTRWPRPPRRGRGLVGPGHREQTHGGRGLGPGDRRVQPDRRAGRGAVLPHRDPAA